MANKVDITVHEGQPWKITFTAHDEAGDVMPLDGADVEFVVSDEDDNDLFTKSVTGGGVTITDAQNGEAEIAVSEADQSAYHLLSTSNFYYAIRAVTVDEYSEQAEGRLIIAASRFSTTAHPLLTQFRMRFPEFTQDDPTLSLYLEDAAVVVDADPSWPVNVRDRAVIYLAAHLLMIRKNANSQYSAGGTSNAGAIRAIRVEDRSVVFDTGSQAQQAVSRTGLNQTLYGQEYLSMLRRYPRFVLRA